MLETILQFLTRNPKMATLAIGLPLALLLSALIVCPRATREWAGMMWRVLCVLVAVVVGVIIEKLHRRTTVDPYGHGT